MARLSIAETRLKSEPQKSNAPVFRSCVFRALGFVDQNPQSKTAGCADRNYWHYLDGKGFAVGNFQVMAFPLCAGAEILPDMSKRMMAASRLTVEWWAREIKRKGLLDEYFRGQGSFCATAATLFSVLAWAKMEMHAGREISCEIKTAALRALSALQRVSHRPDSANQSIAARLSVDLAIDLGWIESVAEEQNFSIPVRRAGWLSEYGGFDLGYNLKCLNLMISAMALLSNPEKQQFYRDVIERLVAFLYPLLVNYTFSPGLGSRGNPHCLTGGMRCLAAAGISEASELVQALENRSRFPSLVSHAESDDKYFVFFHFLDVYLATQAQEPGTFMARAIEVFRCSPFKRKEFETKAQGFDEDAQLLFGRLGEIRYAINVGQGGGCAFEVKGRQIVETGYGIISGRKLWSTCASPAVWRAESANSSEEQAFEMELKICRVSPSATLLASATFRMALAMVLHLPLVSVLVKRLIERRAWAKSSSRGRTLCVRKIVLSRKGVILTDRFLEKPSPLAIFRDWRPENLHSTHVLALHDLAVEPFVLNESGMRHETFQA